MKAHKVIHIKLIMIPFMQLVPNGLFACWSVCLFVCLLACLFVVEFLFVLFVCWPLNGQSVYKGQISSDNVFRLSH